jgi:hypothetical protein
MVGTFHKWSYALAHAHLSKFEKWIPKKNKKPLRQKVVGSLITHYVEFHEDSGGKKEENSSTTEAKPICVRGVGPVHHA